MCVLNVSVPGAASGVSTSAVTEMEGGDVIDKTAKPDLVDNDSVLQYECFFSFGFDDFLTR